MEESMKNSLDQLYELLPVVYRQRDAEQGYPLRALLQVISEQVDVVKTDIAQLYENWFIETCKDWVVPYIGDLVGYRIVHEAGEPGEVITPRGRLRNKILIPRREVANTIRYRRRKGALALLELLSADVAGWPARAVEFYKLLGWTQALNHLQPGRGETVDLRRGEALTNVDGPFDELAHTVDVRRATLHRKPGRYNIPSVGLFVWRLNSYSVTRAPAICLERIGAQYYTFGALGHDVPLYARAEPETEPTDIAGELNLPVPIRRRTLKEHKSSFYGPGKSLQIWTDYPRQAIPLDDIVVADLSDWKRYQARRDQVAVDPELGRILFHPRALPGSKVWVSYHYGFSADVGGGEYERRLFQPVTYTIYRVGEDEKFKLITEALGKWRQDEKPDGAVIEITDSGIYSEQINIELGAKSLQIRAASGACPVIRLLDYQPSLPDALSVTGEAGSSFTLDGLLVTGRPVRIKGPLQEINIRHTTLVPGWALHTDCEPHRPIEPSLELVNTTATRVAIEHSIIGSIQVNQDQVKQDPVPIHISDSILDATSADLEALGAPEWPLAHAVLTIVRSTVFGYIDVHAIELAENSTFNGLVRVGRRQRGCMRFCSVIVPGSRTPRRYNCQPDLVEKAVKEEYEPKIKDAETEPEQKEIKEQGKRVLEYERLRVRPRFESTRYGTPTYAQLATTCAEEIKRGADDESEMGVFHDLYQPQRAANLRARLDEYSPAGMDAGIIYIS